MKFTLISAPTVDAIQFDGQNAPLIIERIQHMIESDFELMMEFEDHHVSAIHIGNQVYDQWNSQLTLEFGDYLLTTDASFEFISRQKFELIYAPISEC